MNKIHIIFCRCYLMWQMNGYFRGWVHFVYCRISCLSLTYYFQMLKDSIDIPTGPALSQLPPIGSRASEAANGVVYFRLFKYTKQNTAGLTENTNSPHTFEVRPCIPVNIMTTPCIVWAVLVMRVISKTCFPR